MPRTVTTGLARCPVFPSPPRGEGGASAPGEGAPRCRSPLHPPRRGFTLLEVTVAFGILLTVLVAVWALLGRSNRHQELLWDEFVAAELAASALEQAFAADRCELTPPQGMPVQFAPLTTAGAENQPGPRVVLHVAPVAGQSGLRELKAVAQWDQRGQPKTLTRTLLRRVTP